MIHFVSLVTHSSPSSGLSSWYRMNYWEDSLVTLKMVTSGWWVKWSCKCHIVNEIQRFRWRVGDECFEMNHRCNQKSHNDLQRWGWRVDECCKNSFFLIHSSRLYLRSVLPPFQVRCKSVSGPFRNYRIIGGRAKDHRRIIGGRTSILLNAKTLRRKEFIWPRKTSVSFVISVFK